MGIMKIFELPKYRRFQLLKDARHKIIYLVTDVNENYYQLEAFTVTKNLKLPHNEIENNTIRLKE